MTCFISFDGSIPFITILAKAFLFGATDIPWLIARPSAEAAQPNACPLHSFHRASAEFAQAPGIFIPPPSSRRRGERIRSCFAQSSAETAQRGACNIILELARAPGERSTEAGRHSRQLSSSGQSDPAGHP